MVHPMQRSVVLFLLFALRAGFLHAQPGTLDPTFDADGKVTTDVGLSTYDEARAVRILPDGSILAAGTSGYSGTLDFILVRYQPDGSLDPLFGSGGVSGIAIGPEDDVATCMMLVGDTDIVVGGHAIVAGSYGLAVARFRSNGIPDTTFGNNGAVFTQYPGDAATQASAIAMQSTGRILLAGGGTGGFAVVRYNTDGSVDSTFGVGGLVSIDFSEGNDAATGMAVLPDDRILLSGYSSGLISDSIAIAQLLPDGTPDPGFIGGGKFRASYPTLPSLGRGLARMADGRFVITGSAGTNAFAARFLSNGQVDAGFNGFGMRSISAPGSSTDAGHSVRVRSDGKVVVAGRSSQITTDLLVAQLNDDGSMDAGFGTAGIVITNFFGTGDVAYDLAVQPDGAIVVAGSANGGATDLDLALARYEDPLSTGVSAPVSLDRGMVAFPSPFTDRLWIEHEQPVDGPVRIDLMDAQGMIVSRLLAARREKGRHCESFMLDPLLAPGVYMIALNTTTGTCTLRVAH